MEFKSASPWSVDNLEEFIFYCCPECEEKNCDRELFLQHAFDNHPHSQEYLQHFQVKEEALDENDYIVKEEEDEEYYENEEIDHNNQEETQMPVDDFYFSDNFNENTVVMGRVYPNPRHFTEPEATRTRTFKNLTSPKLLEPELFKISKTRSYPNPKLKPEGTRQA